jgi:hypothetical protein
MFILAVRSLLARPVRSVVLAGGFGLGVAVMAALLGIGGVILEQARDPELAGGGDVVIGGASGKLTSARFILSGVLGAGPLAPRVAAASPSMSASLYLIDAQGATRIRARGSIPSLERAVGLSEAEDNPAWTDSPGDEEWVSPSAASVLRAMDRFHPIPDVPARADSWAEWLYFNGQSKGSRFYLTFLVGPRTESGRRAAGVRLQLEQDGRMRSYAASAEVDERTVIESAPDLTIGGNTVRLEGDVYRIGLDLAPQDGRGRAAGEIELHAAAGRSVPHLVIRGAGGWVSGYTVPVLSGAIGGSLTTDQGVVDLAGGTGYHDHNWGFWDGVRWQWGQVQGDGLSFVYGRVHPPADAADPDRIPGFLAALGPDGPIGYTTAVTIQETNDPETSRPQTIVIRGRSDSIDLTLDFRVEQEAVTGMRQGMFGAGLDFLQLRGTYSVSGRAGGREVAFTAPGAAETFRGRDAGR